MKYYKRELDGYYNSGLIELTEEQFNDEWFEVQTNRSWRLTSDGIKTALGDAVEYQNIETGASLILIGGKHEAIKTQN